MTGLSLVLERFDDAEKVLSGAGGGGDSVREQQERATAYAEGYAAGEAATHSSSDKHAEVLKSITEALEEKVADFHHHANASLCDGLASIISKVFPALSEKGFAAEAASVLAQMQLGSGEFSISVKAAPDHIELLREAVADMCDSGHIVVEEDISLSDTKIIAQWEHGGVEFDTDEMIQQCLASLEKAAQQLRDWKQHG